MYLFLFFLPFSEKIRQRRTQEAQHGEFYISGMGANKISSDLSVEVSSLVGDLSLEGFLVDEQNKDPQNLRGQQTWLEDHIRSLIIREPLLDSVLMVPPLANGEPLLDPSIENRD